MSGDGRYVAFDSRIAWDSTEIFVRDRLTSQTELVIPAANGAHDLGNISADGRYIAFRSTASNLVPNDTNGTSDAFVRDRQAGLTERVSVASDGTQADRWSGRSVSLSADGRYAAFESEATNLISGETMRGNNVFVRDRETGQTELGSVSGGEPFPGGFFLC